MKFLLIVKASLNRPYEHWVKLFDQDNENRERGGVHVLFRYPVIGQQAVVFGMLSENPRPIHDMMYHPDARPGIEASGLVVGSEQIIVCEAQ